MPASVATAGFGTLLKRGDGGVGAGTQASKTLGASNQALTIKAAVAGTAGNSLTFGIVVSGTSTAYSQVITASSVLINSATDGGGLATTTVDHAIAQLYTNATFVANFQASTAGNGTGVLLAGASGALSGGAAGAEVFTTVAEIKDIAGPQHSQSLIEVTNMSSPSAYREYIPSFLDAGQVVAPMNFINDTTQQNVRTDLNNRVVRNFQIVFVTTSATVTASFAAVVEKFEEAFPLTAALTATVTLKITGPVTYA